jgi:hypothetical protein
LEYFTAIWYILWPLGDGVVIWYIFPRFLYIVCQEKSGNPGCESKKIVVNIFISLISVSLLPDDDDSDQKRRKSIKKTASTH